MMENRPIFSSGMTLPHAMDVMRHFNDSIAKNRMISEGGPVGGFTPRLECTNMADPNQLELPLKFGQEELEPKFWVPTLRSNQQLYHDAWVNCITENSQSTWAAYGDLYDLHDYSTCHLCHPYLDNNILDEPTKFGKEMMDFFNFTWTTNTTNPPSIVFTEDDDLDGVLFAESEINVLEEVEALYDKEKILTCRDKIETCLGHLMFMRKDHYDPELTQSDYTLYRRVDRAILFLLEFTTKFDLAQQVNQVEDTTPMKIDLGEKIPTKDLHW